MLFLVACGRYDFQLESDASPIDAAFTRVQGALGWTARVLVDLTGVVPYNPNDYLDGGTVTSVDIASSLDPTWHWQSVSVPRAPHPLAGSYVVLENNRTLDRDDLIVISLAR